MTFAELKEKHPMKLKQISNRFSIPYDTVQKWNMGARECPQYVITMMDELLTIDEQKTEEIKG